MDSRQQRVAKNEALFREVNERIKEVNEPLAPEEPSDYLCECGSQDCTDPMSLTRSEYEEVRKEATHFAVVPGHVVPDVEHVLVRNDRFAVVEKSSPAAARIAVERDPRS
ncbi:MAG: hypothetical protein ACRDOS_16725 [Gaiellaceae bacterium]